MHLIRYIPTFLRVLAITLAMGTIASFAGFWGSIFFIATLNDLNLINGYPGRGLFDFEASTGVYLGIAVASITLYFQIMFLTVVDANERQKLRHRMSQTIIAAPFVFLFVLFIILKITV